MASGKGAGRGERSDADGMGCEGDARERLAGISAALGQVGITTAYKYAPAKEISVFDYTQVVFAALLGILFLGETPEPLSILGYVIIIGTAFYRWNRLRTRTHK